MTKIILIFLLGAMISQIVISFPMINDKQVDGVTEDQDLTLNEPGNYGMSKLWSWWKRVNSGDLRYVDKSNENTTKSDSSDPQLNTTKTKDPVEQNDKDQKTFDEQFFVKNVSNEPVPQKIEPVMKPDVGKAPNKNFEGKYNDDYTIDPRLSLNTLEKDDFEQLLIKNSQRNNYPGLDRKQQDLIDPKTNLLFSGKTYETLTPIQYSTITTIDSKVTDAAAKNNQLAKKTNDMKLSANLEGKILHSPQIPMIYFASKRPGHYQPNKPYESEIPDTKNTKQYGKIYPETQDSKKTDDTLSKDAQLTKKAYEYYEKNTFKSPIDLGSKNSYENTPKSIFQVDTRFSNLNKDKQNEQSLQWIIEKLKNHDKTLIKLDDRITSIERKNNIPKNKIGYQPVPSDRE